MKANYKDKIAKPTSSEVSLGNLYDMNKQLMEQEPSMSIMEIQLAKQHLKTWLANNFKQKYFMLLCHELRDYTLFNLDKTNTWGAPSEENIQAMVSDFIECLENRGQLLTIEDQEDNAWEIWIRNENGCFAYYFFPYGAAVLEY